MIENVSDTALWVAHYRALESERKDALFHDPFAAILSGKRGAEIAEYMRPTSRYSGWNVITRTWIIDNFIQKLAKEGISMVVNLGAGLDTRPYRMHLPASLRWVEADFLHMIEYKEKMLKDEKPLINLERVSLDLSDRSKRKEFFKYLGGQSQSTLILTEGVLPYLSEEQTASLAEDLCAEKSFRYWIAEYISPDIYRYYKSKKRARLMKNAQFQFFPADWFGFFKEHGWQPKEINYLSEESLKLGRKPPMPWQYYLFLPFMSKESITKRQRQMGYVVFTQID